VTTGRSAGTLELVVVDAFTDRPFAGNPAAVAVLDAFPDIAVMEAVASEMNLSETAYAVARHDGDFELRWFTPTVEIDFCGHATLATAHVLARPVVFHTKSGVLRCDPTPDGWIELDAPADPFTPGTVPAGVDGPEVRSFGAARYDALVELGSAAEVRDYEPDLVAISSLGTRGLIVTAPGDRPGIDCVSRVFAPNAGIAEDPVTGSAHCTLASFWGERLGKRNLVGEQASRRGGIVRMRREGDRVAIGGQAVTVSRVIFQQ
jgi:predicted PhzF superfamily epimerase YddE/YHI9